LPILLLVFLLNILIASSNVLLLEGGQLHELSAFYFVTVGKLVLGATLKEGEGGKRGRKRWLQVSYKESNAAALFMLQDEFYFVLFWGDKGASPSHSDTLSSMLTNCRP
jgi:hypothetical protein